ncbi:hypothetical protein NLJ89_g2241 [Agrocybe chaxingu]|uniref:Uncharacterized protein n=1 Tax=Agrocybe chaxingu TaxID=84603 RepID=A0A9W8MYX3_9AGAR|nr:hypothetical protein NLJ89_g2241 [Agrocybe chaxingu]
MSLRRKFTFWRSSRRKSSSPATQLAPETSSNDQTPAVDKKGFDYTPGEYAVAATELVLSALDTVTTFAPVPYLKEASGLASNLLKTILSMSDVEAGFQGLVNEICGIIIIFSDECKKEPISAQLEKHVMEVIAHLNTLKEMCEKYPRTKWWKKLLFPNVNGQKMAAIKGELESIFQEFYLRNVFAIRNGVDFFKDQNQPLMDQLQQMVKDLQESTKENLEARALLEEETNAPLVDSPFANATIGDADITNHANNHNNVASFNGTAASLSPSNAVDQSFMDSTITGGSTIVNHSNNYDNYGSFNNIPASTTTSTSSSSSSSQPPRRVDQSFKGAKISGSSRIVSHSNNDNNYGSFNQGNIDVSAIMSSLGHMPTPMPPQAPTSELSEPKPSVVDEIMQMYDFPAMIREMERENRRSRRAAKEGRKSGRVKQPIAARAG